MDTSFNQNDTSPEKEKESEPIVLPPEHPVPLPEPKPGKEKVSTPGSPPEVAPVKEPITIVKP